MRIGQFGAVFLRESQVFSGLPGGREILVGNLRFWPGNAVSRRPGASDNSFGALDLDDWDIIIPRLGSESTCFIRSDGAYSPIVYERLAGGACSGSDQSVSRMTR